MRTRQLNLKKNRHFEFTLTEYDKDRLPDKDRGKLLVRSHIQIRLLGYRLRHPLSICEKRHASTSTKLKSVYDIKLIKQL